MTTIGYVYAPKNKSFPGYIKIGQTAHLSQRLKQFNDTGIPDSKPTLLLFVLKITNFKRAERLLHIALADKWDSLSKEYFKASYNQVLCRCGNLHTLSRAAIFCYDYRHNLLGE